MALTDEMQVARHRLVLFCLGGISALALWALAENWDNPALAPPLYLALFTFVASYSGIILALAGPVSVVRALRGALLIAVPVTALVSLTGLRHVVSTDLLDQPEMLTVILVLIFFSTPFLSVWLQNPKEWRSYTALFDAAWTITVRYGVAWIFVGVFWLVVFLSNALFELVGVDIIERLLDLDWAPYALSGAMLGLGLAVVYELRKMISPFLILRLLRLLVPVILVVLVVFLGAVPFRGLTDLFGEFSAAATLMGAAVVAITLISTALDRDDARAVSTRGIRIATRGVAVLLPLLALLAVWAVVLRVRQYGWTPDRVLAAASALFVLAYSVGYAGAVVRGKGWAVRVRNVNVAMALAIIGAAALWLTPVLNVYRISANSQFSRYEAGRTEPDQLPIWALQHDWGKAGRSVLVRLEGQTGRADQHELQIRIDAARNNSSKYKFTKDVARRQAPGKAASLSRLMGVRPEEAGLPEAALAKMATYHMRRWLDGCNQTLPDGRPGCVFIRGVFRPALKAEMQGMVLYLNDNGDVQANYVALRADQEIEVRNVLDPAMNDSVTLPAGVIALALDGAFDIRPSGTNALHIGGAVRIPGN